MGIATSLEGMISKAAEVPGLQNVFRKVGYLGRDINMEGLAHNALGMFAEDARAVRSGAKRTAMGLGAIGGISVVGRSSGARGLRSKSSAPSPGGGSMIPPTGGPMMM